MKIIMKKITLFLLIGIFWIQFANGQVDEMTNSLARVDKVDSGGVSLQTLTPEELQDFEEKVIGKTEDLGEYLKIIAGKNSDYQDVKACIDLACALFISEESRVAISNANNTKTNTLKIRDYLNRLSMLKYDQVEIQWYEIAYVSHLRLDTDGRYYGTVTISQRFRGYIDGKPVYEDVTTKNIQVVLEKMEMDKIEKERYWDVKLGDISVQETL